MPYAQNGNVRLFYQTWGKGDPIIFAHGAGGNAASWWQQVPIFADRYQAHKFGLWGTQAILRISNRQNCSIRHSRRSSIRLIHLYVKTAKSRNTV